MGPARSGRCGRGREASPQVGPLRLRLEAAEWAQGGVRERRGRGYERKCKLYAELAVRPTKILSCLLLSWKFSNTENPEGAGRPS